MFRFFRLRSLLILIIIGIILGISTYYFLNSRWLGKIIFPLPLSYKQIIFEQASENDLDPYLVTAVIYVESHFDDQARSASGALGLMQIMPETGEWAAAKLKLREFSVDKLYDAQTNIVIGCWYLANLRREFGNNPVLILAAYNGGRGNVKQWLEEEKWLGNHETVEQIPFPETKHYVLRVLNTYQQYQRIYHN